MITNWSDIENTEEYQTQFSIIENMVVNSLVVPETVENKVFIKVLCHLIAIQRYLISKSNELIEIDNTPFLDRLASQIGYNLPVVDSFSIKELLKENRYWNAYKGTEVLYEFIGEIVGSPIKVYNPSDYIFKMNDEGCLLSGAESYTGILPWSDTKAAAIRDGIFYAYFTYLLEVEQAQMIGNLKDFYTFIRKIHPAGTKRFITLKHWDVDYDRRDNEPRQFGFFGQTVYLYFYNLRSYPGLSHGLMTSHLGSLYSTWRSNYQPSETTIISARDNAYAFGNRTILQDSLLRKHPPNKKWATFNRFKPSNTDEDDDYIKVYPDEDPVILKNQQENMGLKDLTIGEIKNYTIREIKNISLGNTNKNTTRVWYNQLPMCTITSV